jgi:hypothetical protein
VQDGRCGVEKIGFFVETGEVVTDPAEEARPHDCQCRVFPVDEMKVEYTYGLLAVDGMMVERPKPMSRPPMISRIFEPIVTGHARIEGS